MVGADRPCSQPSGSRLAAFLVASRLEHALRYLERLQVDDDDVGPSRRAGSPGGDMAASPSFKKARVTSISRSSTRLRHLTSARARPRVARRTRPSRRGRA